MTGALGDPLNTAEQAHRGRIVVTGAAGYVGAVLCERLLEAGYNVIAVDSLLYGQQSLFHLCANPRLEFERGDARDEALMRRLIRSADALIPLAAIVGAPACERDPEMARTVNLEAVRLLNKLRSPSQLVVFPTTNSGYGHRSGTVECTEDTPLEPISLYARTKAEAEALLLDSPNTIALRLATAFGMSPRMRFDLLVNHFVYAAITSGYIVLFEKDFRRNYVHVRDISDCFVYCLEQANKMKGQPYNLGLDSANLSKEELAFRVKRHLPEFYIHFAPIGRDPDRRNYLVSSERLAKAGFRARRSLDDGIGELIKGCRMLGRRSFANV